MCYHPSSPPQNANFGLLIIKWILQVMNFDLAGSDYASREFFLEWTSILFSMFCFCKISIVDTDFVAHWCEFLVTWLETSDTASAKKTGQIHPHGDTLFKDQSNHFATLYWYYSVLLLSKLILIGLSNHPITTTYTVSNNNYYH